MNRRTFLAAASSFAALGCSLDRVLAQSSGYPQQTVKVVVPFPAGGAVDASMRIVEPRLRELLGQSLVIENKAGANGILGATQVVQATPDGYTLLFAPREVYGVNPILQAKPPYDARQDFSPVGIATGAPYVLIVHPSVGAKSLDQLVDKARQTSLAYSSFGHGSMAHLNIETMARHFGIKLLHVPYRGSAPAVQAVATGEVALSISTPPAAMGFIADGTILALAVGADRRIDLLPNVPTFAELKQPTDLLVAASFAMAAPAKTPPEIITRVATALRTALAHHDTVERLRKAGLEVVASSPEQMRAAIESDMVRFGQLIRETGIKAE
ncbi:MFS transporter [Alsobacter soli]|uniref:MFS transporter n=1 Tax=Alsobacter soli TaxID=2109933 RepID=A0A2T1HWU8_9HYPH|nr:tripartite tricarboxylate transporter substrate binding protein [Alsobacter soli]PSC06070.1 MFS transporter [Alsobacter soli]